MFTPVISYAVELYSKDEKPFNTPLEGWMSKWWQWWVAVPSEPEGEELVKPGGCLINNSQSMVMLMETTVNGIRHQNCKISSTQGIIVPLWTAFMEGSVAPYSNYSYAQLSKAAREELDLGAVTSKVLVDGSQVAEMSVNSNMRPWGLDYQIITLKNVTELYSKGFNITIPENTHIPEQNAGTWRSGAHGWFLFIKPLPLGTHEIFYNVGQKEEGHNAINTQVTYTLTVE